LLVFGATLLELPMSQLLYPPGQPPVSVAITKALANYDFAGGTAMEVVAVLGALGVVAIMWTLFRLVAPVGWRRLGATG
jgi:iron(III) transport system permease protein